jgi:pyruvate kinase
MRHTKIVATIGPASRDREVLVRMVEAGMDVARLNFSHGTREDHAETARRVREAAGRAGRQVAILQDLPGPKLRIGELVGDLAELKPGEVVTFVCGHEGVGDAARMYIAWHGLADSVQGDEIVYLSDGRIRLRVTATRPGDGEFDAVVEIGGVVASRQGLNIPGAAAALPAVPEVDLEHLRFGERLGVDLVARSFVRRADDITAVRAHTRLPLIAKIERPQAVQRIEEIVRAADCVMVARGDLGIELPIEDVPIIQKQILALAGSLARPCAARPARPGLHRRLHGVPGGARAGARGAGLSDALGPLGAPDLRPPPRGARPRALARAGDRAPLRADVGRAGRLDEALRGHRGPHSRGGRARARTRLG